MGALLVALLGAVPVGACADRAACRFDVKDDAALTEALHALQLTAGDLKAPMLKKAGGDLSFQISAAKTEGAVTVKVSSNHRAPGIWGEATVKVQPVKKPEWKARAQASALKQAVPAALEDLRQRIDGTRRLTISVRLNGLDPKPRDYVEKTLQPCVKSLFDLTGPVTAAESKGGYLDEAIEYLPEKAEPHASLAWQVDRVREALLGGMRAKCSVSGSPIQGWSTFVAADELNGAVVVSFKR
jgi:hypothetical protein